MKIKTEAINESFIKFIIFLLKISLSPASK